MTAKRERLLARRRIPHLDGSVVTGGKETLAVRAEGQRQDAALGVSKAAPGLPDAEVAEPLHSIRFACGQQSARWIVGHARERTFGFAWPTHTSSLERTSLILRIPLELTAASRALSRLASWAWSGGWFSWLLVIETILVAGVRAGPHVSLRTVRWPPSE